jgi:hypothetical protein
MGKNLARNEPRTKVPSKVFQDLSSTNLADLTIDEYNSLISNIPMEIENLDVISDLARIRQFQEKPRGLQLVQVEQSGAVNSSSYVTLLEVPAGKTYDIQVVTMIQSSSADCVITYALDGVLLGLKHVIKDVEFTHPSFGVTVDFSTMGDFLISGLSESPVSLVANRRSGTGGAIHNVFYREVN